MRRALFGLRKGDRIRISSKTYEVTCVDVHAELVELKGPSKGLVTLMVNGGDGGGYALATTRTVKVVHEWKVMDPKG